MHNTFARLLAATLLFSSLAACAPTDEDATRRTRDGDSDDDSSDVSGGSGSSSGQVCDVAEDCPNIACICDDGSALGAPVNSRRCVNDRCQLASASCPASCQAFGMPWTGEVVDTGGSGGGDTGGGGGGGGGNTGAPPGSSCDVASDCQAHSCACPNGDFLDAVRDCFDGICFGAEECEAQCCELGHC